MPKKRRIGKVVQTLHEVTYIVFHVGLAVAAIAWIVKQVADHIARLF